MSQHLPTIHTDRLRIRPFTLDDVDDYHRVINSDADVMRYLPSGAPVPRERSAAILRYFIEHGQQWGFSFMAVADKTSATLMGHVGLHKLSDAVEIGYALGKAYWGGGYATEAARALLRYGFEHHQLAEIIGLAFAANSASRRVMERLGMTYAGETDRYYETTLVLYRLARDQFTPAPGQYLVD
ncbi:MAG: GNAT family N-acetyltransferase [Anaerolineae bacterium]|nr:GNAT family N-acetyltransferase [Anaerolineae bacterium]